MKKAPNAPAKSKTPVVMPALLLAILVIAAALVYKGWQSHPPPPAPLTNADNAVSTPPPSPGPVAPREETMAPAETAPAPPPAAPVAPIAAQPQVMPADPKELVSVLTALDGKQPITPEQAQKWKESLQQLIHQGPAGVPVIQQFLTQNLDANYSGVSGAGALGYNSLRSAMLDALGQIGGPEATQAMLQVMQTSIFPTDIATLAKTLDTQAPGQYQQAILDAVHLQLSLGAMDQLGGANVLPLFQVLAGEAANGANVTADLAQYSDKWSFYSAIALAGLPDNAGVPTLIQLAQGQIPGNQAAAAQALAELAPQNTQAMSTLVDLAKAGQLSDMVLAQLAPYLGGRQYQLGPPQDTAAGGYLTFHMANGNQDFSAYDSAGTMTQGQISQRISIIDQLLQALPSDDTTAQSALQEQRNGLAARQKH
jgi:hypothetical protein